MSSPEPTNAVPTPAPAEAASTSKFPVLLMVSVGALSSLVTLGIVVGSICGTGNCRRSVDRSVDLSESSDPLTVDEDACTDIQCFLRNLETEEESLLQLTDSFVLQTSSTTDYSVRCITGDDIAYMDFFFDGDVHREYNGPYWMDSNAGEMITPVDYLTTGCDQRTFTVSAAIDEDEGVCSVNTYILNVDCQES